MNMKAFRVLQDNVSMWKYDRDYKGGATSDRARPIAEAAIALGWEPAEDTRTLLSALAEMLPDNAAALREGATLLFAKEAERVYQAWVAEEAQDLSAVLATAV